MPDITYVDANTTRNAKTNEFKKEILSITNLGTTTFLTNPSLRNLNTDFPLNICFGSVKLTKNVDPDKYKYSSYDIGFDSHLELLFIDESMKRNFIVFGADMS